ncbi:nephrocystin-4-like protein [Phytophthora infestans T30-4]|uniref:Nephrocystin-4-like protein n=1 Tax=Phytophthora infestans (strain T30-4) TaxID=403677 RepID=D0NBC0_PHYIT|nr:nephrocystin-4-like protein [Phytophthora infestans T30-4]EEY55349.1 nephrocystin-4-like protein [Phytophthora infestans T30-4]|eukprot:XP_002903573.1 nephrocystin-4-like protein [Phytophthora infestans T30-4]
MPVPDGVSRIEKAKGYSLHVMSVLNWVLPDSILHTSAIPAASGNNESEDDEEEEEEPLITLGVHVSLFHAVSKRFFGNTWVSPELAVDPFQIKQAKHPKDGTLRYVIENAPLNFRAYFLSDIIDADCVGVLELVAYEKDPDSKATVRVVGCGWTLLPLFARQQPVQSGTKDEPNSVPSAFSMNSSGDSVSVFTGSPRALWELHPDAWSAQEKHEGSKFYYQIVQYEPMLSIAMFLRKNELVGALDPIPGLKDGNLANIDMGKNPKMLLQEENDTTYEETLESFVKIASLVPKSVQIEEPFELHVVATRVAINLRDEIEANLVSRLRISRTAIHEGATSVEGEISARVLKIALHNGRCFRTRQFMIPLKADPNGGDTLFCVRNHSKLRGFVFHPNMAIVVVLQYTVHFRLIWSAKLKQQALEAKKPLPPDEDVVLVTMGARALVPSDGKKLYLYDKHHHATAATVEPLATLGGVLLQEQEDRRRVLHVDLLSGAACRPYSDNTLYTPPDQVTRSLQNREVSLKDSFAFCDLKITIDEEVPATESNQTEDDEYAADQWARKLLGKANDNPLLAQTLNALATSNQEKPDDQRPKTPSPKKKKPKERPAEPTTVVPEAPTSELSRASKTLLTRYGYMEPHDKPPMSPTNQTTHDKRKKAKKIELIAKSVETEVNDPFKANEIRFHFAAYRACSPGAHLTEGMTCSPAPSRVYFTFQFYNFPPTRTESLRLSKAFDNGAGGEIQTFLLMRDTSANKPAQAIQLDVDTTATGNPLETRRFAEYLKWNNLYVDVWDADSLFQLGTFAIPLHELLRQGKNVKKFQAEVAISPPLGGTMASDHCGGDEGAVCSVPDTKRTVEGENIGRIQLLMTQPRKPKHRVRARPLVESNAELYRLLSQEGFYGERIAKDLRERKEPQTRQRQNFSDTNTLTPKEIAILCELFGSRKSKGSEGVQSTGVRPTRIQCDVESKTGLLALLSLRPPETQKQQPHTSASDHAQRLKRVMAIATKNHLALADAFALFDVNKDGVLSRDEFIKALRSLGTVFDDLSDEDLGLLADLLDTNKDGQIATEVVPLLSYFGFVDEDNQVDTQELCALLLEKAKEQGVDLKKSFAHFDANGDGEITRAELKRGLVALGCFKDMEEADFDLLLEQLDEDGKLMTKLKALMEQAVAKGVSIDACFAHFDKDGDGNIKTEEFVTAMTELGFAADKSVICGVLKLLDRNESGTISLSEFKQLFPAEASGVDVKKCFAHFDSDNSGVITKEEFVNAMKQLPGFENVPDEETLEIVKKLDEDESGSVSLEEFEASLSKEASDGLAQLKKLLQTASAKGVSIQQSFNHFDKEANEFVAYDEFVTGLRELGTDFANLSVEDVVAMAKSLDCKQQNGLPRVPAKKPPRPASGAQTASLDCNYAFNSNPEIRAVELKLRQTALEAYQRGILPLRVVSKFLEDADDRRGQVPGREHRRKRKSELLRVEFLQVLMELGFTLLSDRDEEHESLSEGGMPTPITRMNDHLYARQLERLSRYRQHVKSDEAKAHKQLVRAVAKTKKRQQHGNQQAEESLRRFEDEKNQLLRVLSYYRDGHKKSLVYSLLRQQVTTSLTLFPSFGDLLFFELPFTNPYNHNDRFRLELLLPSSREIAVVLDLEIVRNSEEWAFYRENLPLSYGFITSNAHIEDEMIDDHNEVVMESHDQLHLPMRLRWLDTGMEGKKSKIPVSVVVKSCSHGHTVALFNMELRPQPFVCHRVLRFSHPASSIWRWKLRYPKGKFVVCMDPSVAMELLRSGDDQASNSGLVSFKCRVGDYPALETFFVVLYDDVYYARVFEVWQIRIQSKLRVDVQAVLGQSVRHELVIKGDGGPSGHKRHVMCFTPMQHREFVQFRPAQVFTLMPQAFNRIEFAFCAVENGADTQMVMLVNLVDVETHELVGAWSVHVTLALPVITKTYDLRLPVGRAAQKKISYSNPWDQPQTIMLRSSAPKLLVPREPVLQLPSNGQAFLRLAFAARNLSESASQDIYLFINDKRTDQNEECLLFQVTYH